MERIGELTNYRCSGDATLRVAMERLNGLTAERQFQIVLDPAGRLLGTITDGDIRRAILKGVGLDESVLRCMNDHPTSGRAGADAENIGALRQIIARTAFLPVVDDSRVVKEILVLTGVEQAFAALVMAGGFGKRLGERTRETPKPLLPVGDKPILEHILTRLENANVSEVFVSTHYLSGQIEAFIAHRANRTACRVLFEREALGTAGAVGLMPTSIKVPFMVLNADVLTRVDLRALLEFHERHLFDATIAVAQHQVTIPYGVVRHSEDGHFISVEEKPTIAHFVAAGIYLLAPQFRALVSVNERIDMPQLIERGRAAGLKIGLFPIHEYWTDVGQPQDLERARGEFLSEQ